MDHTPQIHVKTSRMVTIGQADVERTYRYARMFNVTFALGVNAAGAWEISAHDADNEEIGTGSSSVLPTALMRCLDSLEDAYTIDPDETVRIALQPLDLDQGVIQIGSRVRCIFTDERFLVDGIDGNGYAYGSSLVDGVRRRCSGHINGLELLLPESLPGNVAQACACCGGSMTHTKDCNVGRYQRGPAQHEGAPAMEINVFEKKRYRSIGGCVVGYERQHMLPDFDGSFLCAACGERKDHHVDLGHFRAAVKTDPCLLPADECSCSKRHEPI